MKADKYGNYSSCFCLYRDTVSWCTCALCTSQGTRVKQKVSSASQIPKQTLWSWSRLQAKIVIIDPKSYQGTHFFLHAIWEFSDGLLQRKPNIDEYFRIWRISRGKKWHEVLFKAETAWFFQIYVTFLHQVSNYL